MKRTNLIVIGALAVFISACVSAVHPFFFEKDLITDPRLAGEWQASEEGDAGAVWKFEEDGTNVLKLTITEKEGKTGVFTAHLFKLKQERFLDLTPKECEFDPKQIDLVEVSMIPGHLLARVCAVEPELKLAFFNADWLKKHLEENPRALAHRGERERLVLTAGTAELQKFVMKHLGELFDEPGTLVRNTKGDAN